MTQTHQKGVAILGSTGSVGTRTLEVIRLFPDRFRVVALAARAQVDQMIQQVQAFHPRLVCLADARAAQRLREALRGLPVEVVQGEEGLVQVATHPEAQLVVSALVGAVGLLPTLSAIQAGKDIALANKETLVMAGELITREAARRGVALFPVDSEHSALFQVLRGEERRTVRRLILTGSGGPFLRTPPEELARMGPREALRHPTWSMGAKITLDSATLMNKGLEVMEAHWLFGIPLERIQVWIHPQSVVHALVEFQDGSLLAQLARPDMRIPIAYALGCPERLELPYPSLELPQQAPLSFEEPDLKRFPCLGMAYEALRRGGAWPVVLNAANEVAVQAFLEGKIRFPQIPETIQQTLEEGWPEQVQLDLAEILEVDRRARTRAQEVVLRGATQTVAVPPESRRGGSS